MITRLLVILFLWLGSILTFDPDFQNLYVRSLDFLWARQGAVIACSLAGSIILVFASISLGQLRVFAPLYLLARFFFEASQFTIYLLSFAAVVFWFDFGNNLWLDLGLLAAVPFLALFTSCLSLHLFDFNYPMRNRIQRNLMLPFLSLLIVIIARFLGYP